jgi:hypothetical protein
MIHCWTRPVPYPTIVLICEGKAQNSDHRSEALRHAESMLVTYRFTVEKAGVKLSGLNWRPLCDPRTCGVCRGEEEAFNMQHCESGVAQIQECL